MCDKLVAKVDNTDTSDFVLKTKYNTDKTELENKIPDVSNLVKKTKLTELENKLPDISNLATKTALAAVENKIHNVTNLATKTALTTLENRTLMLVVLLKQQVITLELLRLILRYQSLMVKLLKTKMSLLKI